MNKKLIILIILAISAILSLTNGISTAAKKKYNLPSDSEFLNQEKNTAPSKGYTKRTTYRAWGRNPFTLKKVAGKMYPNINLTGIVWRKGFLCAIINDGLMKVGDKIEGNTIVNVKKTGVTLNDGSKSFELKLEE